jgi:hypothetical protein
MHPKSHGAEPLLLSQFSSSLPTHREFQIIKGRFTGQVQDRDGGAGTTMWNGSQRVIRTREQLSMYVPSADGVRLESVRKVLDPVQAGLIPAHVTLCREDEIDQLSASEIAARLRSSAVQPVTLCFGRPVIFQGHGVLLPCVARGSVSRVACPHWTTAGFASGLMLRS